MRAAMFDNLSKSMEKARRLIGKSGTLTAENMKEPLKEVGGVGGGGAEGMAGWDRGLVRGRAEVVRGRWACRSHVRARGMEASAAPGCVARQYCLEIVDGTGWMCKWPCKAILAAVGCVRTVAG